MNPKKIILPLFLFVLLQTLKAQIKIYEEDIKYGTQYGNSLLIAIPYCDKKIVSDEWKKTITNHYGKQSFKNVLSGITTAQNATITGISNQPIDVYYRILDSKTDTIRIATAFMLPDGKFLSSQANPAEYQKATNILEDYSNRLKKRCIELELKDANAYQAELNASLGKFQVEKSKLERSNALISNKILMITQAENDLKNHTQALENQKKEMQLPDKQLIKTDAKLNSNNRKLQEYEHDLNTYQIQITENKENISKINKDILMISEKIKDQNLIINQINAKINSIQK